MFSTNTIAISFLLVPAQTLILRIGSVIGT
jgi:hypothetical protein